MQRVDDGPGRRPCGRPPPAPGPTTCPPKTRCRFSSGDRPRKMLTSIGSRASRVTRARRAKSAPVHCVRPAPDRGAPPTLPACPTTPTELAGPRPTRRRASCRPRRVTPCTSPTSPPRTPCPAPRSSRSARTAADRRSGSAPRPVAGTVLFAVDHHRGSEENQAGLGVARPVRRRPANPYDGHPAVLPRHDPRRRARRRRDRRGRSVTRRGPPLVDPAALVFIDGGHGDRARRANYADGRRTSRTDGTLAIHDVFPDPADERPSPVPRRSTCPPWRVAGSS